MYDSSTVVFARAVDPFGRNCRSFFVRSGPNLQTHLPDVALSAAFSIPGGEKSPYGAVTGADEGTGL